MEIGIDSFAAFVTDAQGNPVGTAQDALRELLDRIQLADEKGLDVFAIGEHHRKELPLLFWPLPLLAPLGFD
jgi:alkanesulfonate monooxygenase SsuD/methylene tetrahydromethanopterin reductase-like flavin-dependent oxidoreductase (luciferase family)